MSVYSSLKEKTVLGETQYYVVEKVAGNKVQLKPEGGNSIVVDSGYVDQFLHSADYVKDTVSDSQTALISTIMSNPRTVMTVVFKKADTNKTKKAYNAEKAAKVAEISKAPVSKITGLLNDLIDNPITTVIPGELRTMKGYHTGVVDERGRIQFTDMEIATGHKLRQVDPRTVLSVIVNGIKYNLKK